MNNRDNFVWRPNDNSATTNLRYSLEAEKWTEAFRSANSKSTTSFSEAIGVVGLIISICVNLIFLVLICITDFVKWILEKREESIDRKLRKEEKQTFELQLKNKRIEKLRAQLNKLQLPPIDKNKRDSLFKKAAMHVVKRQKVSIPLLLFDLGISFDQACNIIDDLLCAGIIGDFNRKHPRRILIKDEKTLELLFEIEETSINK